MKKLLLFGLMVCAILSCKEKEEVLVPDKATSKLTAKDVTIENGVLRFESPEHLKNVINEIADEKRMEDWHPDPGFVSLLKRQKSISQEQYDQIGETGEFGELSDLLVFRGTGENKILEKIVDDPRLAAVLNSNGYITVSDTAYHIGHDIASAIKIGGDKNILKEFLQNYNLQGAKFTKVVNEQISNARVQDYQNTDGNRRIIGEFKRHLAPFYSSLVIKVTYKKKNWIGWSDTPADHLSFTASGTYETNHFGVINRYPYSGSRSGNNVEEVNMFVGEVDGGASMSWYGTNYATMYCQVTPTKLYNVTFYP